MYQDQVGGLEELHSWRYPTAPVMPSRMKSPRRKVSTSALRRWRTKGEVSLWAIQFTKALSRKGDGTTMAQGGDL